MAAKIIKTIPPVLRHAAEVIANRPGVRLGMIFECSPQGADELVCSYLARVLCPQVTIVARPQSGKHTLQIKCGEVAQLLLGADHCDHVFIVWDLYPAWKEDRVKPCRKDDRTAMIDALKAARNGKVRSKCTRNRKG